MYKNQFDSRVAATELNQTIKKIEKLKINLGPNDIKQRPHLNGISQAIDMDVFAQVFVDTADYLLRAREIQIKDAFIAVDVR